MRKRWISGGQDFSAVCTCFVLVGLACVSALAQDAIVDQRRITNDVLRGNAAPLQSIKAAAPRLVDIAELKQAKTGRAKYADHFSEFVGPPAPVKPPPSVRPQRAVIETHAINAAKKSADGFKSDRAKIKQQLVAREEIKKSADDVRQEARLIALNGQGITFEQRRMMKDAAAEWRRQLRLQLIGNVTREQPTDDGLDEAKRVAREQARKIAEEARSQTRRE